MRSIMAASAAAAAMGVSSAATRPDFCASSTLTAKPSRNGRSASMRTVRKR